MSRIRNGFARYWFVAVPAILLNVGMTLDHVIANNHEEAFRIRIKEVALEGLAVNVQDDAPLSETLRAHWITTNEDGNLEGRISTIEPSDSTSVPIEQLDVTLLKKGQKMNTASTDYNGKFTLENVKPGVYTLVAAGQNGFLAYGVNVLPKLKEFDALDSNTHLDIQKLKHSYYVSHFNLPQDSVVAENLQIDAAAVPPEFSTLQRISKNYLPSAIAMSVGRDQDDFKAIGKATNIRRGFQHALTKDGSLEGRIQPISTSDGQAGKFTEMNIFLIQYDIEAARVAVDESGNFKIEDVDPGIYSLVAAGKDGFAALSVELVPAEIDGSRTSTNADSKVRYVSTRAKFKVDKTLGIAIVTDPNDLAAIEKEIDRIADERRQLLARQAPVDQLLTPDGFGQVPFEGQGGFPGDTGVYGNAGTPVPASGPTGGAGGSRVGVFGRRPGAIAAIVGLSLGITAVATNDNNDPVVITPTMPVN